MTDMPPSGARPAKSKPSRRPSAAGANSAIRAHVSLLDAAPDFAAAGPSERRPANKRPRRTFLSCKPCRVSKSKCDEERPCGSCRLRGSEEQCIHEGGEGGYSTLIANRDPLSELGSIRKSLNAIEIFIRNGGAPATPSERGDSLELLSPDVGTPWTSLPSIPAFPGGDAPGLFGRRARGLYSGPTSIVTPLILTDSDEDAADVVQRPNEYDKDLLGAIPSVDVIDSMIEYYFAHCCWIFNHLNEVAFRKAWGAYKSGLSTDQLTLATCCLILATTVCYMPHRHPTRIDIYQRFSAKGHPEQWLYDVMKEALARYQAANTAYSLELLELSLLMQSYMNISGHFRGEESWAVKGLCVNMALAMGLHREPSLWKMPADIAERRRVAWWHVVNADRWQSHLLGRPITIASRHFDTQMPTFSEPAYPAKDRSYIANIGILQLSAVASASLDDAVSLHPVPYSSIQQHDRSILQWLQELPTELDLSESELRAGFESQDLVTRRRAVQSVCLRGTYHSMRFTLHRPYSTRSPPTSTQTRTGNIGSLEITQSMEIAANSAEWVISLACQALLHSPTEAVFAMPGHLTWTSFHLFTAAMFFSLQLIANPEHPSAPKFGQNVTRAIQALRQASVTPSTSPGIAGKGLMILETLAPLYAPDFTRRTPAEQAAQKTEVFRLVKTLAFPFLDRVAPVRPIISNQVQSAMSTHSNGVQPSSTSAPTLNNAAPPSTTVGNNVAAAVGVHDVTYSCAVPPVLQENVPAAMRSHSANPMATSAIAQDMLREHVRRSTYSAPPPSASFSDPQRMPQLVNMSSYTVPGLHATPGWHPEFDPPENAFTSDPPPPQQHVAPTAPSASISEPAHQTLSFTSASGMPLSSSVFGLGSSSTTGSIPVSSSTFSMPPSSSIFPVHQPPATAPLAQNLFSPVDENMFPLPSYGSAPASMNPDVQWGSNVGITQAEWTQFELAMQSAPEMRQP